MVRALLNLNARVAKSFIYYGKKYSNPPPSIFWKKLTAARKLLRSSLSLLKCDLNSSSDNMLYFSQK